MATDAERDYGTETDGPVPVVSARHVTRRYGDGEAAVNALRDVSLDFPAGTFSAIMGSSGSGKSTLMHILAGLDQPTTGTVVVAGVDITRLNDRALTLLRREKIGFVFQFFNLLPTLSAEDNITLPLKIAGRSVDRPFFDRLASDIGLADRLDHRPSELSGGQQQRVAIARALITRPAVIFADEPTGNLDTSSSGDVLKLLRDAVDRLQQTIVMVTHDVTAAAVADRIVYLADGRVVREGPTGTVDSILDTLKLLK